MSEKDPFRNPLPQQESSEKKYQKQDQVRTPSLDLEAPSRENTYMHQNSNDNMPYRGEEKMLTPEEHNHYVLREPSSEEEKKLAAEIERIAREMPDIEPPVKVTITDFGLKAKLRWEWVNRKNLGPSSSSKAE